LRTEPRILNQDDRQVIMMVMVDSVKGGREVAKAEI